MTKMMMMMMMSFFSSTNKKRLQSFFLLQPIKNILYRVFFLTNKNLLYRVFSQMIKIFYSEFCRTKPTTIWWKLGRGQVVIINDDDDHHADHGDDGDDFYCLLEV